MGMKDQSRIPLKISNFALLPRQLTFGVQGAFSVLEYGAEIRSCKVDFKVEKRPQESVQPYS